MTWNFTVLARPKGIFRQGTLFFFRGSAFWADRTLAENSCKKNQILEKKTETTLAEKKKSIKKNTKNWFKVVKKDRLTCYQAL